MQKKSCILILLFLSLTLATSLRLYHLGHASLWLDEIATVYGQDIVNPPAYLFMIKTWIKFFGDGETAIRFPSVIFSLLSIPLLFIFGKKIFSVRVGLVAAILLTVSPYNINYAQEARMYSLIWMVGLISFYSFYRFLRGDSRLFLVGCLLANTFSIYISYSGVLYLFSQSIILFFSFKRHQMKAWIINLLILLVLISPLLPILMNKIAEPVGIKWINLDFNHLHLFQSILSYLTGDLSGAGSPMIYLLFILLIGAGYFRFREGKPRWDFSRDDLFLGAWFFIPIMIGLLINFFLLPFLTPLTIRYIGFIQFPFFLAIGRGLERLRLPLAGGIIIGILLLTMIQYLFPYYRDDIRITKENWRGLIGRMETMADEEDPVVLLCGAGLPYLYYRTGKIKDALYLREPEDWTPRPDCDEVFILYRRWQHRIRLQNLAGYRLIGHFQDGSIGFFRFQSIKVRERSEQ